MALEERACCSMHIESDLKNVVTLSFRNVAKTPSCLRRRPFIFVKCLLSLPLFIYERVGGFINTTLLLRSGLPRTLGTEQKIDDK